MKIKNVNKLYKEMNKRRGGDYDTTDYPDEYFEMFIGHEYLLTEDMDDIISISPYYKNLSIFMTMTEKV